MATMVGSNYREYLKALVKAAGKELIERADDLVGNGDLISSFDIWINFPQDSVPTIEVQRAHVVKEAITFALNEGEESAN